jgi:hypothetical protein
MSSGGGLPTNLEIIGGATLTVSSATTTEYEINFDVTGITYNGTFLNTTDGDPMSINDPSAFTPYGASDGVLKLIDMSSYTGSYLRSDGATLLNFFYSNGITLLTGKTGSASVTATIPVAGNYDFNLLYQTFVGTAFDSPDIIDPYPISFPFPGYVPNKLFTCESQTIAQAGSTYATIALEGLRYNGQLLGSTGSIVFYTRDGLTLNSVYGFSSGYISTNLEETFGGASGITFDSSLGDYTMTFDLSNPGNTGLTGRSSNYIDLNPIYLPVSASTDHNTVDTPGTTITTLTNLAYNYIALNPGDSVGISQAGEPIVRRSVSAQRSVTFASRNARRPSYVYYNTPGSTLSTLFYSTPVYAGPYGETLTATASAQTNISSNANDGFRFSLAYDYTDQDGVSVFSRGHTGLIQVRGGTGTSGFSQDLAVSAAGSQYVTVNYGIPFAPGQKQFDVSFYDYLTGGERPSKKVVSLSGWAPRAYTETIYGTAQGYKTSDTTFDMSLNGFNYVDPYGYSILSPNYIGRSPLTGVTYKDPSFIGITAQQGGTLINITSTGYQYFAIDASTPFFVGTTISGSSGANTFSGTVISSSLKIVGVDCTTFSSPASSSSWLLTGTGALYQGTTGNLIIQDGVGTTLSTTDWVYGLGSYYVGATAGIGRTYTVGFYDQSQQKLRDKKIPFNLINPMASGGTGYTGNTGATGITAYNGGGTGAALRFDYLYRAGASGNADYQILGELSAPIATDGDVTVYVPVDDMSRMFIYQSAWNILDEVTGSTLQGYLGTGTGVTGLTLIDPITGEQTTTSGSTAYYGPNVALLLSSVLRAIQYDTGSAIVPKDRLLGLDGKLSNAGATASFTDDFPKSVTPISVLYNQQSFAGASGSVLTNIPSESIATITNSGLAVSQLVDLFTDIDTVSAAAGATYVPALHNLFEQAVSYQKATDAVPISVSSSGFYANGATAGGNPALLTAWNNGLNTFGVSFLPGDTVTLYVKYAMTKARRFQVDPWVTQGIDPTVFAIGQVVSITIAGTNVVIPVPGIAGQADWYEEPAGSPVFKTYAVILRATPSTTVSAFDSSNV